MQSEIKNGMIGAIVALFFATTLFAVQPPNTTVRCRTCIDSALHVRFPSELDGLRMSSRTTYGAGDDYYNIRYDSDESLARVGGRKLDLTIFKPADGKMVADGVDENLVKLLEAVSNEGEKFAEQGSFKKYKRLNMMVEDRLRKKGLKYMWYSNTAKFQDRGKSHMSIMAMFAWRNRIIILSYVEPILAGKVEPCQTLPEGFIKITDAIDYLIIKAEAAYKVDVYAIADPKRALEALREKWFGVEDRVSPYDMPDYAERFFELDRTQDWCYEDIEKRAEVFLSVAKEGVKLKLEPPVWYYNCACALARMGKKDEAFEALEQAIAAGYNNPRHINQDKDLDSLHGDSRFAKLAAMAGEIKEDWQAPKENARIEDGSIWLNDTNIYWVFKNGSYNVGVTCATSNTLIYLDHNAEHRLPPACDMINVEFTEELDDLGRTSGNANFNFLDVETWRYIPTILGSSAVFKEDRTNYVHSIPARIWGSSFESWNEEWHLYRNVLGVYSIGTDYADDEVDRIFGWNPVSLAYYDKDSEDELVRICAEAWRVMNPEVQEAGGIRQLLGIIRRSQKGVKSEADFMSSAAQRPAISTKDIDELKVVELAAKLNKPYPEIPVIAAAKMGFKWTAINDLWTSPYDSPIACKANHNAVYVARWAERTGRFIVTVQREDGYELVWRLLQGDPSKVRFKKDKSFEQDGCTYDVMEIECDYHEAFDVQLADGIKMKSTRVDIGCFAVKDGVASVPAIVSIFYMPHEKREYGEDGLLKSVDYTKAQIPGWMPQLCPKADFKDVFHWTKDRELTGWTRVSSDGKRTEFTHEGLVVMTRDKLGRPQDVRRSLRMEWLQSLVPFVTANEEYFSHMASQSDRYNRSQDDPLKTTLVWKYTYADENEVWGKSSPKELKSFKYKPELCRRANISEKSGFKLPLVSQMMQGYYRHTKYKLDDFESDAPDWELPDDLFRSDSRYALKERNLKPPVELKKMQFSPWTASSNDLWRIDTASYEKWASEGLYELADGAYRFYRGPSEGNDDGSFASVSETYIAQNIAAESDAYQKLGEKYRRCRTSEIKSLIGDRIDWEATLITEDKPILKGLPEGVSSVIAMWQVSDNVYIGIRADYNTGFKARAYFFAAAEGGKSNGKIDSFESLPSLAIGNTVLDAYAGNAQALNNLAVLWYCGIANPKDYDEKAVIDMLERSSQLGCAAAEYNLGILYYNRGEKDKAEKFFFEAKKKGYNLK